MAIANGERRLNRAFTAFAQAAERRVALRRTSPVLVNRDRLWWVATAAVIVANALLLTTAHLAQAPLEPFARWALRSAIAY
jgi:hypothetical protein